ncbi:MAG: hypothetical protein GXP62_17495 [Oligoflexia bacterium]|nr:hypothetical protein [Oligoflexia bacterium]
MEDGQILPWARPMLRALADGWLGQVEPDLSAPPYTTARLQGLVQALQMHAGTRAKPFEDGRWDRADWPARVALLVDLKQSLRASEPARRPALESIYAKARQQLRLQLVSERDRAMADGRMATAELAQAVLVSMVGQSPAHARSLTADDAVATWIRGALLAPANRPEAASLVEAALAHNRLDLVGLTLPKVSVLLADPHLAWGPVQLGAIQADIGGPTVQIETLMHAWSPSATVPNPAWQAAQAEARYLDQAIDAIDGVDLARIEQLEQRRTGIPSRSLAVGPGSPAPGHDLKSWRSARLSSLRARRNAIEALSPTTGQRHTSLIGFEAQVQRWSGTASRTLRLVLPSGTYQHQPSVDVSEWRYLRNRGNPRVDLPGRDQFVDRSDVIDRAQADVDAHLTGDLAALLRVGIRARTWDQAMALPGDIADRSREAAALLWLLTGQEAPDLLGIGSVEGLAPGGPRGIAGDALLVRISLDGERAVLLRDPYTYEVFDVETGLRLFGPDQVDHRVDVFDGGTDDLSFRPDGRVVRIANTLVDLDTGRRLGHETAWPQGARPVGVDPALVSQVVHRGQKMVRAGRPLDPGSSHTVALPQPSGDTWVLDHGFASPDLGHVAVQLRGAGGNTAVVVLSLDDGSILQRWTQGSPRLAKTPDGIAVTTLAGLQLARWSARGVDLRTVAPRPDSGVPFTGPVGVPVWGPAVTAEVFDKTAVLYGDNGTGGTAARAVSIPSGDRPELLDQGRVLLTHGRNRLYLTRLPTWIAAPR